MSQSSELHFIDPEKLRKKKRGSPDNTTSAIDPNFCRYFDVPSDGQPDPRFSSFSNVSHYPARVPSQYCIEKSNPENTRDDVIIQISAQVLRAIKQFFENNKLKLKHVTNADHHFGFDANSTSQLKIRDCWKNLYFSSIFRMSDKALFSLDSQCRYNITALMHSFPAPTRTSEVPSEGNISPREWRDLVFLSSIFRKTESDIKNLLKESFEVKSLSRIEMGFFQSQNTPSLNITCVF